MYNFKDRVLHPLYCSYIYIYIHIDIHFLLGSTDNPNSLLSKIFLFDSPRQRWKGCRRGYLIFPSMYRRPTLRFSRDILSRGGEGGFLINGDLGFLHWIRPDTIIRAKSSPRNTFLPPFFEIQFGIFEPFTFCALFTHPTRDRYAPREDIKALPCLVSKGARIPVAIRG